nr:S8 family serine peptidase [Glycomyces sp. L485]
MGADDQIPCQPPSTPQEGITASAWGNEFIGAEEAHEYNRGTFDNGDPVTIAVIDSGVQADLDIFGGRVLDGFDPWDPGSAGKCDAYRHGTGVAAIAAGGAEGDQFIGVAPEANILPLRAFEGEEGADEKRADMIADLITDAVANDADVVNLSIAAPHTPKLQDAVEDAIAAGVVVVAATGNGNLHMDDPRIAVDDAKFYPANYPDVIAVGAHNPSGNFYEKTNYGDNMDLLAPGDQVTYPYPGGGWYNDSGTSFAAPYVAGAAALLKGNFGKDTSPAWIEQRLKETAIPPPNDFNIYQGHGVLNVFNAMTYPDAEEDAGEEPAEPAPIADDEDRPQIDPIPVGYDPLGTEKTIAWASLGAAAVLIILVLVLRKLIPNGRRRGWRPGSRKEYDLPEKSEADTA